MGTSASITYVQPNNVDIVEVKDAQYNDMHKTYLPEGQTSSSMSMSRLRRLTSPIRTAMADHGQDLPEGEDPGGFSADLWRQIHEDVDIHYISDGNFLLSSRLGFQVGISPLAIGITAGRVHACV